MPNNEKVAERSDSQQLTELLGVTENASEAGFILADGRLLHLPRKRTHKQLNHLDAIHLLMEKQSKSAPVDDNQMIAIMAKEKLIRFNVDGIIHSATHPTSMQIRKIYQLLAYRSSVFEIILSNAAGMTLAQHRVSGPTMGKLVNIFKAYQEQTPFIQVDEFFVQQTATHYQLVFRPTRAVIGSINKNTKMLKIEPEYKNVSKLFYQLIAEG